MRRAMIPLAALVVAFPAAALANGIGGFGAGLMNGYYQGEQQQLEIQRLQLCTQMLRQYQAGGPPPPPECAAPSYAAPVQQPPVYRPPPVITCDTQHFGNGNGLGTWDTTTCR